MSFRENNISKPINLNERGMAAVANLQNEAKRVAGEVNCSLGKIFAGTGKTGDFRATAEQLRALASQIEAMEE